MTSFAESYKFAMAINDQHIEPALMRLGSKADSRSVSVSSLASMARQSSDSGNRNMEVRAEYFSTGPGRSSSTSVDFSKTLPEAAGAACDTPRLSTSVQEQHIQQHEKHFQQLQNLAHGNAASSMLHAAGNARHQSSLAPIQAGVPLNTVQQDTVHSAAAARATAMFLASSSLDRAPLLQQDALLASAAAAHAQDSRLWQQHILSSTGPVCNQHLGGPTSLLPSSSVTNKPRHASCCVVPDSHYEQRALQLQQLMEAKQQLQAELLDVQQQQLLGQQQQLQHLQQQQQQQPVDATAGSRRRRASYCVSSSADYTRLQLQQQQQQLYLGTQGLTGSSCTGPDDDGSLHNWVSGVLDAADLCRPTGLRRSSMDVRYSMGSDQARLRSGSNRMSLDLPRQTLDGRGLPPQLQLLLQQQHQEGMTADAVHARKQRRASCCVGPDGQYLQQLQQQLYMQEQQLAQEQQLRASLLQAQHLQQRATAADVCRQRRASCCVLPSAYPQPQSMYDAMLNQHTYSSHGQTAHPRSSGQNHSSGVAAVGAVIGGFSPSPPRQGTNPVPLAAQCNAAVTTSGRRSIDHSSLFPASSIMQQQNQGRNWHPATPVAAATAADESLLGFGVTNRPLSHASSGCSSHSSGGACGGLPAELALMRGASCDTQMDEAIAGIALEPGTEQQRQQHRPPQRISSCSSSSSKQGGHPPVHSMDRQTSMSSYASDDTMETMTSGGLGPTGLAAPTGLTTLPGQPGIAAGMINHEVAGPAISGTNPGQQVAAAVGRDHLLTPAVSPTKRQASLHASLELVCGELKHLLELKGKLARAAAAAPAGSAAAAACNVAQARNNETIQQAMVAKAALESAMYGGLDSIGETDQDMLVE